MHTIFWLKTWSLISESFSFKHQKQTLPNIWNKKLSFNQLVFHDSVANKIHTYMLNTLRLCRLNDAVALHRSFKTAYIIFWSVRIFYVGYLATVDMGIKTVS